MNKTIPEIFFENARKYPNKPALLYKKEGVYFPISYAEFAQKVEVFSSYLLTLGLGKGDKVAILSENRPEWAISDLAVMSIGAVTVPLHTTFNPRAVCAVLNHCEAKVVVVSSGDLLNKILLEENDLKKVEKIIFIDNLANSQKEKLGSKIIGWSDIFSKNYKTKNEKIFLDANACCSIIYTSGTTGDPKGVVLSHSNFISNIESINKAVPIRESDVFLSFLPLSHVLERLAGYYTPIYCGSTIAYAEGIKQLPVNLKEIKPTIMVSVPRVFEKFYDAVWDKINSSSKFKKVIFKWALKQKKDTLSYKLANILVFKKIRNQMGGNFRFIVSGGASLSDNIAKFFSKIGILIIEGYGLTETSPVIALNLVENFRFGTVGKVLPDVELKITREKQILVKGPNVFCEYYNNKDETAKCFDKEGWFYTGDLGFIDKDGFLTVTGRSKEMIITSGGKNVSPEKVENFLNNDRFISQAMAIGNKRKFISALIVPDWQEVEIYFKQNNIKLEEHEKMIKNPVLLKIIQDRINDKINPNLHEFEQIRKFAILPQEFSQEKEELTATLKLRRHIIEKHYQKTIDCMYDNKLKNGCG